MKWIGLKNYLSPTFLKEIDKVSQTYMSNIIIYLFSKIFYYRFNIRNIKNKK